MIGTISPGEKARMTELYWLPGMEEWRARLRALAAGDTVPGADRASDAAAAWAEAVALANTRLGFVRTNALDPIVARRVGPPRGGNRPPPPVPTTPSPPPLTLRPTH